jgi:hypothetical protein
VTILNRSPEKFNEKHKELYKTIRKHLFGSNVIDIVDGLTSEEFEAIVHKMNREGKVEVLTDDAFVTS